MTTPRTTVAPGDVESVLSSAEVKGPLPLLGPRNGDGADPGPGRNGSNGTSSLRTELLFRLRQDGPSSPEQLATRLGASRTGVLQQLRALETSGFVARQTVRHGVGRPRHVYDVTDDAQDLFPSNYDGLATGLLAAIRSIGGDDLIDEVFEARRHLVEEHVRGRMAERLSPDASLADRVRELAVIQDELGYLCDTTAASDGTLRIREHNCAIHHVASDNAAACRAELDLFRSVLGADVVRETHIAAGDRCCSYRIREAAPAD